MTEERKVELEALLKQAKEINSAFYGLMWQANFGGVWHAHVEWCGVMSAYIDMCQYALEQGQDFADSNIHVGERFDIPQHKIDYLNEKFECIFAGRFKIVEVEEG